MDERTCDEESPPGAPDTRGDVRIGALGRIRRLPWSEVPIR
jgi:hypothetical protein